LPVPFSPRRTMISESVNSPGSTVSLNCAPIVFVNAGYRYLGNGGRNGGLGIILSDGELLGSEMKRSAAAVNIVGNNYKRCVIWLKNGFSQKNID